MKKTRIPLHGFHMDGASVSTTAVLHSESRIES
jgi:hypothetical protein